MKTLLFKYRKTYNAGLLQAKAFRILKNHTNSVLEPHDISSTEWGILGLLINDKKGMMLNDVARELGVKAPYITKSMTVLIAKGYVVYQHDDTDARVKIATITKSGEQFVKKIEPKIANVFKKTFSKVSYRNLAGYIVTLHQIVEEFPRDLENVDFSHLQD